MNAHASLSVADLLVIDALDTETRAVVERYVAAGDVRSGSDIVTLTKAEVFDIWKAGHEAGVEDATEHGHWEVGYIPETRELPPGLLPERKAAVA